MGCLKLTHDQRPELRVVHGKKAVASSDWVKRVRSSYLFGMLMPGRHDEINGNPYTYGFNGMERDEEVKGAGNSYDFGARMQDPRLGRWLSPDPMEAKYPMYSTYSAFNNNPIIYIDPDGKDWEISTTVDNNGNQTVLLTLNAAVVNSSSNSSLNTGDFVKAMQSQIKSSYSIKYTKTIYEPVTIESGLDNFPSKTIMVPKEVTVTVNVQVNARVISNKNQLTSNEHLIEIKDNKDLPGIYGKVNEIGGTEVYINESKVANMMNGNDNNTLVHELGHTLGLRHIDQKEETLFEQFLWGKNPQYMTPSEQAKNPNNAMFSGSSPYMNDKTSTQINGQQMESARDAYNNDEINQK